MKCRVEVSLKPGVLDAEGNAAADGLKALGFKVDSVSFTKEYVIEGKFTMEEAEEMCRKLLSNPIIQDYRIEALKEGKESGAGASAKGEKTEAPAPKSPKPAVKKAKAAKKPGKAGKKAKKRK